MKINVVSVKDGDRVVQMDVDPCKKIDLIDMPEAVISVAMALKKDIDNEGLKNILKLVSRE